MWNYNNGQILKQMLKGNMLETSEIAYIEVVIFSSRLLMERDQIDILFVLAGIGL